MSMILADMNNDAVLDLVHARFHSLSWKENFYYNAFRLRGSVFKDSQPERRARPSRP
jgi:hypothetical protein